MRAAVRPGLARPNALMQHSTVRPIAVLLPLLPVLAAEYVSSEY